MAKKPSKPKLPFKSFDWVEAITNIYQSGKEVFDEAELEKRSGGEPEKYSAHQIFHKGVLYQVDWIRGKSARVGAQYGGATYFKNATYFFDGPKNIKEIGHDFKPYTYFTPLEDRGEFKFGRFYEVRYAGPGGIVIKSEYADNIPAFIPIKDLKHFILKDDLKKELWKYRIRIREKDGIQLSPTINVYTDEVCAIRSSEYDNAIRFKRGEVYNALGVQFLNGELIIELFPEGAEERDESVWVGKDQLRFFLDPKDLSISEEEEKKIPEPDPLGDQVAWTHWFIAQHKDASLDRTRKEWLVACAAALRGDYTPNEEDRRRMMRYRAMTMAPMFMDECFPFGRW